MQVLLLATGEKKKLAALSGAIPTPLLPVANRPVMAYKLEQLARQGYKDILVNLYWLPGSIEAYFQHGQRWGINLEYILQKDALGDAGALRRARSLIHETCLVMPADNIDELDIAAFLDFHRRSGGVMTLACVPGSIKNEPVVQLDMEQGAAGDNRVAGMCFGGADRKSLIFTGAMIIEPQVLDLIPQRTSFDLCTDLVPAVITAGMNVHAFCSSGYFNPLSSFDDYQRVQEDVLYAAWNEGDAKLERSLPTHRASIGQQAAHGVWIGRHASVHPTVRFRPPVIIGENSRIGRNVELGPDVVIGENVIVDDEASIQRSTILAHTYVGQLVNVDGRIVNQTTMIDTATQEHLQIVDDFLLGGIQDEIVQSSLRRVFDFLLAVVFLLFALPIMLLVGLFSLVATGGVLEGQACTRRSLKASAPNGEDSKHIYRLLRFRTRRSDGKMPALMRWVNRSELDRLPELWNVLRGDLSMVGPKPLSVSEAASLKEAWQQAHFDRVPGFTGLWYFQTNSESDMDEVLVVDAYYIAMSNWRKDARLLWNTPKNWFYRLSGRQTVLNVF